MADVPTSEPASPRDDDDDDDPDAEDDGTPAPQDSEPPSEAATPQPEPEPVPRKRRLGRPPKIKPPGWDTPDDGDAPASTPAKRGRGRGGGFGRGGGRWARRGGPSHVTQQPIDKEGNMMNVENDEVSLPEDAEGETKVDKMGHLQGDREYRCRTFTVLGRGQRLYMLSTEPARCVGFRDSYLFFTKHKRLYKIIIDDDEKRDLIDRELIPHSYKGRAIGIVTARSVFREFGAQIIVGGKRVYDDYEVTKARAEGVVAGELADPNDVFKVGEPYNKNQYVAWHGASSVYHSGAPTVPLQAGKAAESKKRRVMVNDTNWMLEHALEARYAPPLPLPKNNNIAETNQPLAASTPPSPPPAAATYPASTTLTQTPCNTLNPCNRPTHAGSPSAPSTPQQPACKPSPSRPLPPPPPLPATPSFRPSPRNYRGTS
jgi:chromatin structure-remodeling complex protein RSC7